MPIILWVIHQLPFTATRIFMNVVYFLKYKLFAGAFFPIEGRLKYFFSVS